MRKPLLEYLLHGVRYAFLATLDAIVRGMPTAYAALQLADKISSNDVMPVWKDPEGSVRGSAIEPLYISVPKAARRDSALYELLALVDALRIGRVRGRRRHVGVG